MWCMMDFTRCMIYVCQIPVLSFIKFISHYVDFPFFSKEFSRKLNIRKYLFFVVVVRYLICCFITCLFAFLRRLEAFQNHLYVLHILKQWITICLLTNWFPFFWIYTQYQYFLKHQFHIRKQIILITEENAVFKIFIIL